MPFHGTRFELQLICLILRKYSVIGNAVKLNNFHFLVGKKFHATIKLVNLTKGFFNITELRKSLFGTLHGQKIILR